MPDQSELKKTRQPEKGHKKEDVRQAEKPGDDASCDPSPPRTYQQLLDMPAKQFINYIYHYLPKIEINVDDPDSMTAAGSRMAEMANILVFFSQAEAYAGLAKRDAKWAVDEAESPEEKKKQKRKYEDMVDKEKILQSASRGLETQYRAINRALTVWLEASRDRYMPDSIRQDGGRRKK